MANQIGTFFLSQDEKTASDNIAEHIRKYWDSHMRAAIIAHLDTAGSGLDPKLREAIETLRASQPPN